MNTTLQDRETCGHIKELEIEVEMLRQLLKQTADCLEDVATKEVWGWAWEEVLAEAREALCTLSLVASN